MSRPASTRTPPRRFRSDAAVTALQFAISGVIVVVLVGAVAGALLERTARREAIDDAQQVTTVVARGIVQPALPNDIVDRIPSSEAALDAIVRERVLTGAVVRLKLWRGDGTVLYSDEHALIGHRYTLGDDEQKVLRTGGVDAELSDLSRPENRYERHYGKLLEVYVRVRTPDGTPLLFESYQRYSAVEAQVHRVLWRWAPLLGVALLLLEVIQVPLAISGARRLQAQREDRLRLLERAADASAVERQRIARDLHDGVVQELAGVSMGLHASASTARAHGDDELASRLERSSADLRTGIRGLRTLLVEIHPPSLRSAGLHGALEDLVSALPSRGLTPRVDVALPKRLPPDTEATLFRVAQEATRNAERHARATTIAITLRAADGVARLTIADDGAGFEPDQPAAEGHIGLVLIRELVESHGGHLSISSSAAADGTGTTLTVEVPFDDD